MLDVNGRHPADWLDRHWSEYRSRSGQCRSCHGGDLRGGIANRGCFDRMIGNRYCHANGPGGHGEGWIELHGKEFAADNAQCAVCHGSYTDPSASGGITQIGCFSASVGTRPCHASGPGHTVANFVAPAQHGQLARQNLAECRLCHATETVPPRFNLPKEGVVNGVPVSMPQGCETGGCHAPRTAHPVPWLAGRGTPPNVTSHALAAAATLAAACSPCHGVDMTGREGIPSCLSGALYGVGCHTGNPATAPTGCLSCHGSPPSGNLAPNRRGSHAAHGVLAEIGPSCTVCHNGFVPDFSAGTPSHANGAPDIAIPAATYRAKAAGAPAYSGGVCVNVSCHGGQVTPPWLNGTIDQGRECGACHRPLNESDQYNGYGIPGDFHSDHVEHGVPCGSCHDMSGTSGGNGHFSHLATPAFELHPRATVRFFDPVDNVARQAAYHEGTSQYTCTFICHDQSGSTRKNHGLMSPSDQIWKGLP